MHKLLRFIIRMEQEDVPEHIQKIMLKKYLTEKFS